MKYEIAWDEVNKMREQETELVRGKGQNDNTINEHREHHLKHGIVSSVAASFHKFSFLHFRFFLPFCVLTSWDFLCIKTMHRTYEQQSKTNTRAYEHVRSIWRIVRWESSHRRKSMYRKMKKNGFSFLFYL